MPEKPLLLLSRTEEVSPRNIKGGGSGSYFIPTKSAQKSRLQPKLEQLNNSFENKRLFIQQNMAGFVPEMVLVLEIIGTVEDFYKAVKKIPEMEWLAEFEEDNIEPDQYFYDIKNREKPLGGRLYMIMTNMEAMKQLVSMWNKYKNGTEYKRGLTKWRDIFSHLKDLRFWNIKDRFENTGLEQVLIESRQENIENIKIEIEFWFRKNADDRNRVKNEVTMLLEAYRGRILKECVIPEISYHAILIEAPIECFNNLTENTDIQLLKLDQIMFFRPVGQAVVSINETETVEEETESFSLDINPLPVIALLDGLPLANHELLNNRLIIDDPDNFEDSYPASDRIHGTAMASLILDGDLNSRDRRPLDRKIYVRPILKPNTNSFHDSKEEIVPLDYLPIDLVHTAVKRIFEGDNQIGPVAPTVKIINLSVADSSRDFALTLSPWARLLDWLTIKYNVLFIVSIGNCADDIKLSIPRNDLATLTEENLKKEVIKSIFGNMKERRILSPSESLNSLSVGSAHFDYSNLALGSLIDVYKDCLLPSPINRNGYGFKRGIKPDILMNGGRHLFREKLGNTHSEATLIVSKFTPLGNKVASPGPSGSIRSYKQITGTSNATALTTHLSGLLYDELNALSNLDGYTRINNNTINIILKALIVHGASWLNEHIAFEEILSNNYISQKVKEIISCYFGYGFVIPDRLFNCENHRVTIIGFDELTKDNAHSYRIPIPNAINGQNLWKRLTLTLAWNSPVNMDHNKYRKAALWFNKPENILKLDRKDTHWQQTQRGTIQHDIYEGSKAISFETDTYLDVKINCMEDAPKLTESIPYAFVATFEIKEELDLDIYTEIKNKIQTQVRV